MLEYIERSTDFQHSDIKSYFRKIVKHLVKIHTNELSKYNFSFLDEIIMDKGNKKNKIQFKDKKENVNINTEVLVHGDYWPGNILCYDNIISGIIDWEDAGIEDPLLDVSNARLELLRAFDIGTMNYFTDYYN